MSIATAFIIPIPTWSASALYFFRDELGIPHYSDARVDERYQPLHGVAAEPVQQAPGRDEQCAEHVCIAVPEQIRVGQSINVTIRIDDAAERAGWIDIGFDPKVLACQQPGVTSGGGVGRLRLPVKHAAHSPFSARLACRAVVSEPVLSELRIVAVQIDGGTRAKFDELPGAVVAVVAADTPSQ